MLDEDKGTLGGHNRSDHSIRQTHLKSWKYLPCVAKELKLFQIWVIGNYLKMKAHERERNRSNQCDKQIYGD